MVALRIASRQNGQGAMPLFGRVGAEGASDADVVWDNGVADTYLQAILERVIAPPVEITALIGKWVQINAFPEVELPDELGAPPKSPAASGVVLRAYSLTGYGGAPGTGQPFIVVACNDGRSIIVVPSPLGDPAEPTEPPKVTVQDGRRQV